MRATSSRAAAPFAGVAAALAVLAACSGDGSDVGPRLDELPEASTIAFVLDDGNRGVAGATVAVDGSASAVTGRNGRTDLFAEPRGTRRVTVSGDSASARAADRLGTLSFTAAITRDELPYPIHLPDASASATHPVFLGTQPSASVLDDTAVSGVRLELPAGTSVGGSGAVGNVVTLRTASLQPWHLPGDLPPAANGALLAGRGVYLDPPGVTFTPPVDLVVTDDLVLPIGGPATLLRLDPVTGTWGPVAALVSANGSTLRATGGVAAGGLYAFVTDVASTATVRGRAIDAADRPLGGVYVAVDQWRGVTANDGTFLTPPLAATNGSGGARPAALELAANGRRYPAIATSAVPLTAGALADAGDRRLDTEFAGNLRVQHIKRSRAEPLRRFAVSSLDSNVSVVTFTDAEGRGALEDVPAKWFGYLEGHPLDFMEVWLATSVLYLEEDTDRLDWNVFFDERYWFAGSRNTRCAIIDSVGGGPIRNAAIVQGSTPGQGGSGLTNEGGVLFVGRGFGGRATASARSVRDGFTIVHALTFDEPDNEGLEFPLRRVQRAPLGAFDRFGLVRGTVTGASPAAEHRLRATRLLEAQEWWDDVVGEEPIPSSLPIEVDPAVTHGPFTAGVGMPVGHLAVVEGATTAAGFTLASFGLLADVVPQQGGTVDQDLPLAFPATTVFQAPQALAGLDPALLPGDLRFDLALEQPSGRVIDVVRGVGPNFAASGADASFTLPALAGPLANHRWLVSLHGATAPGTAGVEQRTLLRLGPSGAVLAVPQQPVPDVTEPLDSAIVPAAGFTVRYSVPPGTLFTSIELVSVTANDHLLWQAIVRPTSTDFDFWQLPPDVQTPLVAGRTYRLTVRSHRATAGLHAGASLPYRDRITAWHTVGAVERGDDAVGARSITVTAN